MISLLMTLWFFRNFPSVRVMEKGECRSELSTLLFPLSSDDSEACRREEAKKQSSLSLSTQNTFSIYPSDTDGQYSFSQLKKSEGLLSSSSQSNNNIESNNITSNLSVSYWSSLIPRVFASSSNNTVPNSSLAEFFPESVALFSHVRMEHLLAGVTGGVASTLILHPLDLVKIRFAVNDGLSSRPQYDGLTHAFKSILKNEGFKGLYR